MQASSVQRGANGGIGRFVAGWGIRLMLASTCHPTRAAFCWPVLALLALAGCDNKPDQAASAAPAPPPAVMVALASTSEVTPASTFVGRIEATDSVDLRARVPGFLERQLFREGADVKAGDLLFLIEKAPYQAVISEIEATITRAQATLQLADLEVDRQSTLVSKQAAAKARLDEAVAKQGEARGDLQRQEASLEKATLDLSYTDIKAPLAGRIGRAHYSVGDLVGPESGALATIVAQDPVYVTFPVTQRDLLEVRRRAAAEGGDPPRSPSACASPMARTTRRRASSTSSTFASIRAPTPSRSARRWPIRTGC